MACNSYQTYHSKKSCGGYPACNRWDRIYFPDFVANSCCNPICQSSNEAAANSGCNICNGGGYGFCDHGGCSGGYGCGCNHGGCDCNHGGYGCDCNRGGCNTGWGCCGYCPCGCQDWWGCRNGFCPR